MLCCQSTISSPLIIFLPIYFYKKEKTGPKPLIFKAFRPVINIRCAPVAEISNAWSPSIPLSYSKKIQHIIQIYFFSDMDLIFRFSHIIQQKFQNQGTSKSSSFNLKIRKSHWHINILDISHTNKPRVLHCFGEKIAFSCARCCTDMILAIFSQIFLADCFITSFSIFTTKPTAFIAQEFYFCFLL